MQEQESSDNQNLLISDEKQFSLEYIPFKKRKLFVHKHTLRENEASNTNGKNWTKNLDFTPISESKETEKYSGEESEEEKGSKRGVTEGGGRGRGWARDYTYSINVLSLVNDQAKHENMQIKENNLIGSVC